jgi:hypothetical protein
MAKSPWQVSSGLRPPIRRSLSSSKNKTGIARNIGKPASLFNDLFLYNIQSLDEMGRSALAALVKGALRNTSKIRARVPPI